MSIHKVVSLGVVAALIGLLALMASASSNAAPLAAPVQTPTPTPTATDRPVGQLERSVSLRLRRHLVAKGLVSANNPACWANARVILKRLESSQWVRVASTRSDDDGFYRMRPGDREGAYRASVRRDGSCPADRSPTRQHAH
ncbi:MAG TPA: hypothetical protein VNC78_12065 [Actinomycetota bacterium]|nr:hypothetical protein [Actinomycetota bacterium]